MGSKLSGSLHIRTHEQLSWVHTLQISDCREQDGPVVPTAAVRSIVEFMLSLPIGCLQPVMSRETRDSTWAWGLPGSLFEIKRCLLLGRKVMTNLDSILKSRGFTLPTKFRLVKAMVFPVVMYGCESWTVKKAESQRIDASELWCCRRLLRVPWTARRSNQSILKEISPGWSLEGWC